jgi:hypothetical protein
MIKCINSNDDNTLLIFSDKSNNALVNNFALIKKIKKSNIFNDILIFDYSEKEIDIEKRLLSSIYRFFLTKKVVKETEGRFDIYDNIYLYFDCSLLGHVISQQKKYYTLLEDGTDTFKVNLSRLKPKKNIKYYIKSLLNFPDYAQSKYIKEIEVNNSEDLNIYGKKILQCPKKEMIDSLSTSEKEKILNVFVSNFNIDNFDNSDLLITQPLSEDNIIDNEQQKIDYYKKVLNDYSDNTKIIIKPHPRENTDYEKYFDNCFVFRDTFPVELINFYPINFNKVITIASTSINLIYNCNEKIYLGWEWLEKNKERK